MPSDDPICAVRVLRIQREEATPTPYRTNICQGVGQPVQAGSQSQGGVDTMLNVRDLLQRAANGTGYAAATQAVVAQATSRFALVSLLS
ncbi:hypothetical protein [Stutzerimonas stutzeri]|uniref:hypothetical protein n=1 Tax=Stutzerimonas stutzeri TaxID=316 RepID=UPI003C705E9D